MQFRAKQIAPPKDWATFEDLCHALFKAVWQDPYAQKHGRRGQKQQGVDVFGSPGGAAKGYHGVQCKGKDRNYGHKVSIEEIREELAKTEQFSPPLKHWIFATTSPSDAALQKEARQISSQRAAKGLFTLDVLGWEEIQALMANAPKVIEEFYPEHTDHLQTVLDTLRALPTYDEMQAMLRSVVELTDSLKMRASTSHGTAIWRPVSFSSERDIGPALMGRPLGPADAVACPRLPEAGALLTQLKTAYSVRLVGEPGAGKSVCAYQAALALAEEGFEVLRLEDSQSSDVRLEPTEHDGRRLIIIDDAHLMPSSVLRSLEEVARSDFLVLSIHNAVEKARGERGSILLDGKRAVKTIAAALREDLPRTLKAVRKADDDVGEAAFKMDLRQRIDHAEQEAAWPWQFCFILGGGWRRAKQAADAARGANADIVLAAIAMRQLASRDAIVPANGIVEMLHEQGMDQSESRTALAWLQKERLILSEADCRCPHQRFAAVVLQHVLAAQDKDRRLAIGRIANSILCDVAYPLAGLRQLLHELRFGGLNYRWGWLVEEMTACRFAERCWQSVGEERMFACFALEELSGCSDIWVNELIAPYSERLSNWISDPLDSAYGIGNLLNHLINEEKELAASIISSADAIAVAQVFSEVTPDTSHGVAELMRCIGSARLDDWNKRVLASLDKAHFISLATDWPKIDEVWSFAHLCQAMMWWDSDLALQMAEQFIPTAQAVLDNDPIQGFRQLDDIAGSVLHIFDVLGVYVGKLAPNARQWAIGREMCAKLDPVKMGQQLSNTRRKELQATAFFLHFLFRCAPRKFAAMLRHFDWLKLEKTLEEEWSDLSHDAEVLLGVLHSHPAGRELLRNFVTNNLDRIESFPPRLALIAPEACVKHVSNGKRLGLSKHGHVDHFGGAALAIIQKERPDLLDAVLEPHLEQFAKRISMANRGLFDEDEPHFCIIAEKAPNTMERILAKINVGEAEEALADCLGKKTKYRRTAAIIVEAAVGKSGSVGEMARRLRKRYPKASIPAPTSPVIVSRRRRRGKTRESA